MSWARYNRDAQKVHEKSGVNKYFSLVNNDCQSRHRVNKVGCTGNCPTCFYKLKAWLQLVRCCYSRTERRCIIWQPEAVTAALPLHSELFAALPPITRRQEEDFVERFVRWWTLYAHSRSGSLKKKTLLRIFTESQAAFLSVLRRHEEPGVLGCAGRDERPADGAR